MRSRIALLSTPIVLLSLFSSFALVFAACGDDDSANPVAGPDAATADGAAKDGGGDSSTTTESGVDAAIPIRCTDAELAANDRSDGGAFEITFPTGAEPAQYTNRCATVKVGGSVTFAGAFTQHPLEPAGGDAPNPIPLTEQTPASGKLTVTFPKAGTFGFECEFHPTIMFGAIKVVP